MKVKSLTLMAASCFLMTVSCDLIQALKPVPKKKDTPASVPVEGPRLVGRIATVPADKKFVLIQSYGKWEGETGQILTTRGPENRTANLKTTGEKLGEFVAADIQSGTVETGDAVYSQHVPKPSNTSEAAETPQSHENPSLPNVQKNN